MIVAEAALKDVPVTLDGVGSFQAPNTVTVRAQVEGTLLDVAFREGQDVKEGDVLARIDPATYQAQYDQAVAQKAQFEAQLANARRDFERYNRLAKNDYGTQQQADTAKSTIAQFEAQVRYYGALIDQAKTTLDRTVVRAPISGRTGVRGVDKGNYVTAGETTSLVTITQVQPIAAVFTLPQQNISAITKALSRGTVAVEALTGDGTTVLDRGQLEVIDNQVDQATGTVKLKATFPNAELALWPGQFTTIRVAVDTLKNVVTVPGASRSAGAGRALRVRGQGRPDGRPAGREGDAAGRDPCGDRLGRRGRDQGRDHRLHPPARRRQGRDRRAGRRQRARAGRAGRRRYPRGTAAKTRRAREGAVSAGPAALVPALRPGARRARVLQNEALTDRASAARRLLRLGSGHQGRPRPSTRGRAMAGATR